jgi:copper chaperone
LIPVGGIGILPALYVEGTVMSQTSDYVVDGMTCSHCVAAVRNELEQITGVIAVDVDLASGAVAITSETAVPVESVTAAVEEAG